MKFLKNRTVLGAVCIVLSLLICFALTPLFNQSVSRKTTVVRVVKSIQSGEQITKDMLSDVVRGLIGVLRGDDSAVYFQMLSHDFKALELQRLKGRAQKIPPKIRVFSFVMLMCFLLTYMVIIAVQIMRPILDTADRLCYAQGAFNVNAVAQAQAVIDVHAMVRRESPSERYNKIPQSKKARISPKPSRLPQCTP